MTRLFFLFLSIAYVAGIFLFANSPMISTISLFNPYSLLHVPLYGILAFLLYFSFNTPGRSRFLLPGLIAFGIGIADEIHQAFVPGREASVADALLDLTGIIIALWVIRKVYCRKKIEVKKLRG
jgi:VanZ family protein